MHSNQGSTAKGPHHDKSQPGYTHDWLSQLGALLTD